MDPLDAIRAGVRDVPDFPKEGILFKDITPLLSDPKLFRSITDHLVAACQGLGIQKIAGIEARGFLFGGAMADRLDIGFIPVRKKGKLPWKTESISYQLEYGEAELEIHTDAFQPGERVILIDDLLATGGTAAAAAQLVEKLGAEVVQIQFVIELAFLNGRAALGDRAVKSLLVY